jgi:hypothetical protein
VSPRKFRGHGYYLRIEMRSSFSRVGGDHDRLDEQCGTVLGRARRCSSTVE